MSHSVFDEFDGWETYPQNISFDSIDIDNALISHRISQYSKDLFVAKDASGFRYLELGSPDKNGLRACQLVQIDNGEKLLAACTRTQESSLFFLNQSYTWSRLSISEEHFRKLFTCLKVHPDFLDIVYLFCEKIRPQEESFNGFFFNHHRVAGSSLPQTTNYNIGYNIKFVSRHGRKTPQDPFSIREVGIYQQYSSTTEKSSWIFLQASEQLQDQLRRKFERCDDPSPQNQISLHSTLFLGVSKEWRDYLNYLEEEFSILIDRGFYANVKGPQFEGDVEAHYSDIRNLQILTDKLQRLRQILGLNIRLGNQMKESMRSIARSPSGKLAIGIDRAQTQMDKFLYDQQTSSYRVQTLILRSSGIGQLVLNLLEIQASEANKQMGFEMKILTEQGVNENKLMKRLTEQTRKDTKSMMAIALVSAIFIPATFFATLFGSNFFAYSQVDNDLIVASNFWIYIAFTTGFSAVTLCFWFSWQWRKARQADKDVEMQKMD